MTTYKRDTGTSNCQEISRLLAELKQGLTNVVQGHPIHSDPIYPFMACTRLRSLMRGIADELECKSQLVELDKQRIEKSKSYLEGLQYYKSMLVSEIEICDIKIQKVQDIVEEECQPQNWVEGFKSSSQKLYSWMEQAKNQKTVLARKKMHKEQVENDIKKKKKLFNEQLPTHLTKLQDGLKTVMGIFDITPTYLLNPVKNLQLANIHSYLLPLKECRLIKLNYQDEVITVSLQPQPEHSDIRLASQLKLNLESKEININIQTIADQSGSNENRIVISVDRSCDFTNEELFNRLINDEPVQPIFPEASTEEQRNCNARYLYFRWLDQISQGYSNNLAMTPEQFYNRLISRSLTIQLVKLVLEGLRTNKLNFYFRLANENHNTSAHLKKLTIVSANKMTLEHAKSKMFCPLFVRNLSDANYSTGDKQAIPINRLLESFFQQHYHNPQDKSNKHQYYEIVLTYFNTTVEAILMMPCNYPDKRSRLKLTKYGDKKGKSDKTLAKEGIKEINDHVLLKLPNVGNTTEIRPLDSIKIEYIERLVNGDLAEFGASMHPNFYLVYQVNRLLTILDEMHQKELNGESGLKRYQPM